MSRKRIVLVLPLSLALLFSVARPSLAATPITAFGVTATVTAGCSASAAAIHGSYAVAITSAASSVSVNCTNITQYVIAVSALAHADSGTTMPIGNFRFPLASLANFARTSGSSRDIKPSVTVGAGLEDGPQPLLAYGGIAEKVAGANQNPDAISIAITY